MAETKTVDGRRAPTPRRGELRAAVLEAATRLLLTEGPRGLATRRVAAAVGVSTTAIYTLFGGKEGLVDALYLEGFERLRVALEEVPRTEDALADLEALGWAYRASALADPDLYAVMFGRAVTGYAPPRESVDRSKRRFRVMVEAVQRCIDAGVLVPADPVEVADVLWAAAHGMVSLELAGYYPDPELARSRYRAALVSAVSAYLPRARVGR